MEKRALLSVFQAIFICSTSANSSFTSPFTGLELKRKVCFLLLGLSSKEVLGLSIA